MGDPKSDKTLDGPPFGMNHPATWAECLVVPSDVIRFDSTSGEALICIHNISPTATLVFHVAASSSDAIDISPQEGALAAGKHVQARLRLLKSDLPERVLVRSAQLPSMLSAEAARCSIEAVLHESLEQGLSSQRCRQHMLRCEKHTLDRELDEAAPVVLKVTSGSSVAARLAAAEKLALL